MKKRKLIFLGGVFWEVVRFVLLFSITFSLSHFTLIMWIGSVQLMMIAGFLFLYLSFDSYKLYTKLLAFGKLLNFFPAIIALVLSVVNDGGGFFPTNEFPMNRIGMIPLILIITLLDLIFFIFLISYNSRADSNDYKIKNEESYSRYLPKAEEVTVEEE